MPWHSSSAPPTHPRSWSYPPMRCPAALWFASAPTPLAVARTDRPAHRHIMTPGLRCPRVMHRREGIAHALDHASIPHKDAPLTGRSWRWAMCVRCPTHAQKGYNKGWKIKGEESRGNALIKKNRRKHFYYSLLSQGDKITWLEKRWGKWFENNSAQNIPRFFHPVKDVSRCIFLGKF